MNQLSSQTEYWDRVASQKTFTHPLELEKLKELLPEEAKILDCGCGYGRMTARLQAQGYHNVIGVDTSQKMIERGHTLHRDVDLRHINEPGLPFADESFDACILLAVLTCIPEDAAQKTVINELFRVLAPGGILCVSDYPLQENEKNRARYQQFCDEFGTFGVFRLPDGGVVRHHTMEWIEELLQDFEIVEKERIEVLTMNGNRAEVFQSIARKPV